MTIIKNQLKIWKKISLQQIKVRFPVDERIKRQKKILKLVKIKNGEKLTKLSLKSDNLLLANVFQQLSNVSINEFGINLFYAVFFRDIQCNVD